MNSQAEHRAIVEDKGLKMKIKRKSTGLKSEPKHEIVPPMDKDKTEVDTESVNGLAEGSSLPPPPTPQGLSHTPHAKTSKQGKHKSKKGKKSKAEREVEGEPGRDKVSCMLSKGRMMVTLNRLDATEMKSPGKPGASAEVTGPQSKRQQGPQEQGLPLQAVMGLVGGHGNRNEVGVVTEPDCLGPCEPGTNVTLEGIVWTETENGMLVVNVTWRGKTYIGTLLDAGQEDWAPPSFGAEAEARATKGRGRRPRGVPAGPDTLVLSGARRLRNRKIFAPSSPARAEDTSILGKRKGQQTPQNAPKDDATPAKRARSADSVESNQSSSTKTSTPALIECPEDGCKKKYCHANGLRYHQTHAHRHSIHTIKNSQIYGPKDMVQTDYRPKHGSAKKKHRKASPLLAGTEGSAKGVVKPALAATEGSAKGVVKPALAATEGSAKGVVKPALAATEGSANKGVVKPAAAAAAATSTTDQDNKHGIAVPSAQTNDALTTASKQPAEPLTVQIKEEPGTDNQPLASSSKCPTEVQQQPTVTSAKGAVGSTSGEVAKVDDTKTVPVSPLVSRTPSTPSSQHNSVLPPVSAKLSLPSTPVNHMKTAAFSHTPSRDSSRETSPATNVSAETKLHKKSQKHKDRPQILNIPSSPALSLDKAKTKPSDSHPVLTSPVTYPFHSILDRSEPARFGGPAVFHSAEAPSRGLDLSLKTPKAMRSESTAVSMAELGPPHLEPMVSKVPDHKAINSCDSRERSDDLAAPILPIKSENMPAVKLETPRTPSPMMAAGQAPAPKDTALHSNIAGRNTHLLVPKLPQRSPAATTDFSRKPSDTDPKRLGSPSETKPLLKSLVTNEAASKRSVSPCQQLADLSQMQGHDPRNNPMQQMQIDPRNAADAKMAERRFHLQKYVHFQQQKMMEQQQHQQQQRLEQWHHEHQARSQEMARIAAQNGLFQGSSELHKLLVHDERMSLSPPISHGVTTPPGMLPVNSGMPMSSAGWVHPHSPSMYSKMPPRGPILQNGAVYSGNPVHGNSALAMGRYMASPDGRDGLRYSPVSPQLPMGRPL